MCISFLTQFSFSFFSFFIPPYSPTIPAPRPLKRFRYSELRKKCKIEVKYGAGKSAFISFLAPVLGIRIRIWILACFWASKIQTRIQICQRYGSLKSLKKGVGSGVGSGSISQRCVPGSAPKCHRSSTLIGAVFRFFLSLSDLELKVSHRSGSPLSHKHSFN